MATKIAKKIVGYSVKDDKTETTNGAAGDAGKADAGIADVIQMHETLKRPEVLLGSTYKLKVPEHVSEHAMYITINDYILNEGTEHESRRPYEVFINTKNLDHFQWIVALTVIMSAVFRKGGDITFLVDELRSVFDPRGGYWVKGTYKPSIIAEIGDVIERHLTKIGMLQAPELDDHQKELIEKKQQELAAKTNTKTPAANNTGQDVDDGYPADAKLCSKCNNRSSIVMDGCMTCLNCGDSKCG